MNERTNERTNERMNEWMEEEEMNEWQPQKWMNGGRGGEGRKIDFWIDSDYDAILW